VSSNFSGGLFFSQMAESWSSMDVDGCEVAAGADATAVSTAAAGAAGVGVSVVMEVL
jgi:hypothetical protein